MAQRSLIGRLWYDLFKRVLQLMAVGACQVRCSGRENIPSEGGVLVVSNHQSHLDPPLIGLCCPRLMNFLARETLFGFAPFAWLIASVNAYPIDREGTGLAGIKETLRRLKRGEMVVIFPEGTRTGDGQIAPFRPGFITLATRCNVAVQPAAVDGAFDAWPRWRRFPVRGRVRVHFGRPLSADEIKDYDGRQLLAEVQRRVHGCLATIRQHPDFAHRAKRQRAS